MKTMTFAAEGDTMLVLHTARAPSEAEWSAWLAALSRMPKQKLKILVFTDGGGPTVMQRGAFLDLLGEAKPPMAYVSNSPAAKGAVTALSWFNNKVKLFAPKQLDDAYAHLGLSNEQGRRLFSSAQRATAELGGILAAFKING
jgi:hypothetical protein